ncbi:MAG: TolC family protein [Planctomycetaceae bacterium]|nr:TolC family protein [Planctomycetaceae bacterium]
MRALRLLLAVTFLLPTGCTRQFWRHQADTDVYDAVAEKLNDPRWTLPRVDIEPDPQSRFYDPSNPDHSPLPPDDPAAHTFMHWVDGWQGYKGWHKFGDLMSVENPQWLAQFGIRSDLVDPLTGDYLEPVAAVENLTLPDAVELSLIHNRDYQTQLENVYLAALDVTFERFQFGVRYLINNSSEANGGATASISPEGGADSVAAGAAAGLSQLLPAGTQLTLELANNTLWLFSGGNQTQSASLLSYSITQPLLIGAGRKVGLESLTQVERTLLYQIRELARFRQQFFTDTVGANTGGFLGLLLQTQSIRNEQGNIWRLERQVDRLLAEATRNSRFAGADLVALPPGLVFPPEVSQQITYRPDLKRILWRGTITDQQVEILRNLSNDVEFQTAINSMIQSLRTEVATLDVLQLQASLASSINRLRGLERAYQDTLDSFKIQLGLPPDMVLTINDRMLAPFEIISTQLTQLETDAEAFVEVWGQLDDADPKLEILRQTIVEFSKLQNRARIQGLELVGQDLERVEQAIPRRLAELPTEDERQQFTAAMDRARFLYERAKLDMDEIHQAQTGYVKLLASDDVTLETRQAAYEGINLMREDLLRLMQNLAVVQVSLRIELIDVIPFEMSVEQVVRNALENRLDLMNARAEVMDSRRDVEIAANRLQAAIDLVVSGNFRNSGGNRPFNFSGENSQLRAGIQFTTPLDQIQERNNYRESLINYQRARRAYMLAEDLVKQQVRRDWRQLVVLRRNLETSRRAVRLAALQYDSAVNESNAPVDPRQSVASQGRSGLQGNNLLNALNAILQNQNALLQNWIDYERNRLNIYRDMGTMEIGPDGMWDDSIYRKNNDASDAPAQIRLQSPEDTAVAVPDGDHRGSGFSRLGE